MYINYCFLSTGEIARARLDARVRLSGRIAFTMTYIYWKHSHKIFHKLVCRVPVELLGTLELFLRQLHNLQRAKIFVFVRHAHMCALVHPHGFFLPFLTYRKGYYLALNLTSGKKEHFSTLFLV